jgi:hypothetical protein
MSEVKPKPMNDDEEEFCEYWDEEKGCQNDLCPHYHPRYVGNCDRNMPLTGGPF